MTQPLFLDDLDALKKLLRLGAVEPGSEAEEIIQDAVIRVRVRIFDVLGEDRVGEITSLTYDPQAMDQEGLLRGLARSVEARMVKCILLRTMPFMFLDSSGNAQRRWNDEALTREDPNRDLQKYLEHCEMQIQEDLDLLSGKRTFGQTCGISVWDGTPDTPSPVPGLSLRQRYRRFGAHD